MLSMRVLSFPGLLAITQTGPNTPKPSVLMGFTQRCENKHVQLMGMWPSNASLNQRQHAWKLVDVKTSETREQSEIKRKLPTGISGSACRVHSRGEVG